MKRVEKVSTAVIRRLPRYYRHLSELQRQGIVRISSNALGTAMGLTASQIRQDLFCFGEFGQQGYGYRVDSLRDEVAEIMGINAGNTVALLGVGNLGRALMDNFRFDAYGFTLKVAFDVDENIVGTEVGGIPVYHVDEMEQYLSDYNISVGVITVPKSAVKSIADRLVETGIRGIWNFTNMELSYPEKNIIVESVHFSDSLLTLSYMIKQSEKTEKEQQNESE